MNKSLLLYVAACLASIGTYAQAPTIASVAPDTGAVGTLVTIIGTNLNSPTAFTIGGVTAIAVSNNGTTLVGLVMPGATTGAVSVTTAGGGPATGASNFVVIPTPYPSLQQGNKLVGTGYTGALPPFQAYSVALSADGNTAIVGGDADNSNTGAVWVYTRSGGTWTQQGTKLTASDATGAAYLGFSVSLSADGSTALVGGYADNGQIGAAWVFIYSGGTWSQQGTKLTGSDAMGSSYQGSSVSLSADGNTALVGGDNDSAGAGAVWVYTRSAGVWTQEGSKLVGTGATGGAPAQQGWSVALSADGNTAIVGGNYDNNLNGAAWVFTQSGGVWTEQGAKLVGTGNVGKAQQGYSVAISADGNTAMVGGFADNTNAGAAWVYTRSGGTWTQQGSKLVGTGTAGDAQQGTSVSLSADGNTALVGGPQDNGYAGAAWAYTRSGGVWAQQGTKLVGTGADGAALQGISVSLSADGGTGMVAGPYDNGQVGAAWVYIVAPVDIWLGTGGSTDWFNTDNWSLAQLPGGSCTEQDLIPSGVGSYPILTGPASAGNLTIESGANIDLAGNTLSVCGNWTGGSGSDVVISGNGIVLLNGGTLQTVKGNTQFDQLTVGNTSGGVTVRGDISMTTALVMQQGNLTNSGGGITLLSNALGTAYYDDFTNGTAGTYTGNLTVQGYISNTADGYRDLSSPVSATVAQFASSFPVSGQNGVDCWYAYNPYPNVQIYNESLNSISNPTGEYYTGWISYTGLANPLSAMRGIAIRTYVGTAFTDSITGTPYTGPQSATITNTASQTPSADGWNFIGNPYPSSVSWNAIQVANPGLIAGSYYVFNTTGEYTGDWGAWNGVVATPGFTINDNIPTGQGFFVSALEGGSQTLTLQNNMRTTNAAIYYGPVRAQDNEVELVLAGKGNSDGIITYTNTNATAGYDPAYDALKMPAGSTVYISYALGDKEYAINVMNSIDAQTVLPLNILVTDTGSYTLTATTLNVSASGLTAYFEDAQTNTLTDLSSNNTVSLTLNGGQTYSGRFSVIFKANPSGINSLTDAATRIYSNGNTVYVQRSGLSHATISISNMLGQQVSETYAGGEITAIQPNGPEEWYAIVKVTEGDKVSVAKVLISNK